MHYLSFPTYRVRTNYEYWEKGFSDSMRGCIQWKSMYEKTLQT